MKNLIINNIANLYKYKGYFFAIFIIALLGITAIDLFSINILARFIKESEYRSMVIEVQHLCDTARQTIGLDGDKLPIMSNINKLKKDTRIVYVYLLNKEGQIIIHFDKRDNKYLKDSNSIFVNLFSTCSSNNKVCIISYTDKKAHMNIIEFSQPVNDLLTDRLVGKVVIAISDENIKKMIVSNIIKIFLFSIIIYLFMNLGFYISSHTLMKSK